MINPKVIAEFEQAQSALLELVPMMKQFQNKCEREGFTKEESFEMMRDIYTRKVPEVK